MLEGVGTLLGTFLLAALIIYLSYVFSKYVGKGVGQRNASRYMRLADQMFVGQNRTLAIVQTGERYFLLGITPNRIELLTELRGEDLLPMTADSEKGTVPDFKQILSKLGKKGNSYDE